MKSLLALGLLALAFAPMARAGQLTLVTKTPVRLRPDTAGGRSSSWQLSTDGRYLLFLSDAANLVPGQVDANGGRDAFLYDRVTGATILVTRQPGTSATAAAHPLSDYDLLRMTPDGRYVAYQRGNALYLFDRVTGTTVLVDHKAGAPDVLSSGSLAPGSFGLADDGSVLFASNATDLVAHANDPTHNYDVFFWDRRSGKTTLISHAAGAPNLASDGLSLQPEISGDGRWAVFSSTASNLAHGGRPTGYGVFLYDRATGKAKLVSHASSSPAMPANASSNFGLVSSGGTFVLFSSNATNLVAGQQTPSPASNVFLYETATGKVTLVSHAAASPVTTGDGNSGGYLMTRDGAWIAFTSQVSNLVAGQTSPAGLHPANVFLFERATGRITLASRAAGSPTATADGDVDLGGLSADGRWVAFSTSADNLLPDGADANGAEDVFLFDRLADSVSLVSASPSGAPGNFASYGPAISADGNWIAYTTQATNVVAGKRDRNGQPDVVLYERPTAKARLVSLHAPGMVAVTPNGASDAAAVSADGRYSVFVSGATDLIAGQRDTNGENDVFLYDRTLHATTLVSRAAGSTTATNDGQNLFPRISADGRFVAYLSTATNAVPGQSDPNESDPEGGLGFDVFLFDRIAGTTTLVSHAAGSPAIAGDRASIGPPTISADGAWIAFSSFATDLAGAPNPAAPRFSNAYLYDRATGQNVLISHKDGAPGQPGNESSYATGLSADGQVVLLLSQATDLIPAPGQDDDDGLDAFVLDRSTGVLSLVSRTASATPTAAGASAAVLSSDGGAIAFISDGDGLVAGQTGSGVDNLYLQDRRSGVTRLVSHAAGSPLTPTSAPDPLIALSADGRWVAFASDADNLVAGQTDANGGFDLFLYDRDADVNRLVSHASGSATTTGDGYDTQGPSMSADGRFVSYISRSTDLVAGQTGPALGASPFSLFVYDRATGANTLVTHSVSSPTRVGNGDAGPGVVSAAGNVVLFSSAASDLVPGDFTLDPYGRSYADVFLYGLP